MLRRINEALPGLVAGIVLYGLLIQITGLWFVEDKVGYSIGLWYGIAIAIGMAVNLAVVICDSMAIETDEKHLRNMVTAKSLLRYIIVAVLFGLIGYFNFGNLYTAFLGVLGLKASAYLQPLLARTGLRMFGHEEFSHEGSAPIEAADK